ncbi:rho GDP-dissociation inhibitor 1 isoform X2 [Hibiscus syriacus]|uniref:Rho GDP-dissociation inhibitor 1 isoform X2 n=1 Tax=Hibiscus syriacus TaxID=106335 RepID=A0A6A2ZJV7_HIBSY|nr:rho GDP-dissociation inhibitor 1 isoform X2 [Hibiscus syriacus]
MIPSSESLSAKDYSLSVFSSKVDVAEKKPDTRNIEEAELSLRESSSLNYEEARALLGRIEYQKGNIEAALHVFEGIDIAGITPKMKLTLAKRVDQRKRRSNDYASPPMSIHAVSLLLEAIFLKAKSLQHLQRFREAAQSCTIILDIVESSLPEGSPENFGADCKLQETLIKSVELLPELWKFGDSPYEAILSYRRALLHQWNLDAETTARIQKQFAIFLLIGWDPSILDHLSFALSMCGDLKALANQIEELLPGRGSRLCSRIVNGIKNLWGKPNLAEEGINFARRALESLDDECNELEGTCNLLLGVAQSTHSKSALSESNRVLRQSEALQSLESAWKITRMKDPTILYHLSLENAERRKLEAALYYSKFLLKLEGGSNIKGWLLLARIFSAQKRFVDGETVLNAALDQTGKWDQGELLRTKAKLQIAQEQFKSAIETYSILLAVVQVQRKSFGFGKRLHKDHSSKNFELEIWHDLAYLYISLSQCRDAEICLSKSKAISSYSAVRNHATAVVMRQVGGQSSAIMKSLLMNALRADRMNPSAWYNLAMLHEDEDTPSSLYEATECFEAASVLEDSAPVEPFR